MLTDPPLQLEHQRICKILVYTICVWFFSHPRIFEICTVQSSAFSWVLFVGCFFRTQIVCSIPKLGGSPPLTSWSSQAQRPRPRSFCATWVAGNQYLFLVPSIGGRWYIITQLAIYKWYISGIYYQLGDYISPTTYWGNQETPLRKCDKSIIGAI